ncbi:MAG: exopolysaccharide transport family protein [Crocinitomicaceae bacterium]|nr:exopolysaccharide transport family protein [Crocinitomicaceae bacterium]
MIFIIFICALFLAKKIVDYTPNTYRTISKIKLDDQKFGFSGNNLYGDFDVISTENKIEAEAELLQSPLIIEKALDSLNLKCKLYRLGRLKNTLLYNNSPIKLDFDLKNQDLEYKTVQFEIKSGKIIGKIIEDDVVIYSFKGELNSNIDLLGNTLKITKVKSKKSNINGHYSFQILTKSQQIQEISSKLNVKAIDKEVAVLRIVYTDNDPEKVYEVTKAIANAYILDYIYTKSNAANQTVQFIDDKILEVSEKLELAESNLEKFKKDENVVNTRQETETGLREISKLNIQLVNLEMNEQSMIQLQKYISSGEYFDETSITFGFGDLLMTELVKKMKLWQDERQDLLVKYKPNHELVQAADKKIEEVREYIKEGIKQNLREINIKKKDIEAAVEESSHMFDDLPTREKTQHILEREFNLLENVYNFLSKKRIEASIASSVNISFHRIIQPPIIPSEPTSPNKTLIYFIAGTLSLFLGISIIYLRKFLSAAITSKEDLERYSSLPIAGIIRKGNTDFDFDMLAKSLIIKNEIQTNYTICVSSTLSNEGKTYVSDHLRSAFSSIGYKTVLHKVDKNNLNEKKVISNLKIENEIVILDTEATSMHISGIEMIKVSDLCLYVMRAGYTRINYIPQADFIQDEYNLKNIHLLLNNAHQATNYNGNYIGSRFHLNSRKTSLINRLSYFIETFIKR